MREELTARQHSFAILVAKGTPQGKAYLEAGYSVKEGPKRMQKAHESASRLASNAKVRALIERLRREAEETAAQSIQVTTTDIVKLLHDSAFFDPMEVLFWERVERGKHRGQYRLHVRDIGQIPQRARRQIKSVRFDGEEVYVIFHDPRAATRLLGEHLGMWQGEAAGNTPVVVDQSQHVTFVDAPRRETVEEWQARVSKRFAAETKDASGR